MQHILVRLGWMQFHGEEIPGIPIEANGFCFVHDRKADAILQDIVNTPHAFVLGCIMDRQIDAERAWMIPIRVFDNYGTTDINALAKISEQEYIDLFVKNKYHRFNETMAKYFYAAIQRIVNVYHGNASQIWANNPSSADVVSRFQAFKGAGPKICTMATNILFRKLHVQMSDTRSIDISPDIQVCRVFSRMGLVESERDIQGVINVARQLSPDYPGVMDYVTWRIGRDYCHPTNPQCNKCPVATECPFAINSQHN